ncbi:hypothetical protein GZH46_01431 [Fragariocoptes setiger]|uniref:PH domain-containing protein n=1 Tax=Fragariocoptes setiger TaxID=1670756 RepID=A0ABQ7S9I0_9ACAR|nr:hypothetical protein GZH46_01431 [Fragariocoptes setiger]
MLFACVCAIINKDVEPLGALAMYGLSVSMTQRSIEPNYVIRLTKSTDHQEDQQQRKAQQRAICWGSNNAHDIHAWVEHIRRAANESSRSDVYMERSLAMGRTSPLLVPSPDCLGYLHRYDSSVRRWRLRFFVLKDACLYVYRDTHSRESTGAHYLHGFRVRTKQVGERKHAFELAPPERNTRRLLLMAESELERKRLLADPPSESASQASGNSESEQKECKFLRKWRMVKNGGSPYPFSQEWSQALSSFNVTAWSEVWSSTCVGWLDPDDIIILVSVSVPVLALALILATASGDEKQEPLGAFKTRSSNSSSRQQFNSEEGQKEEEEEKEEIELSNKETQNRAVGMKCTIKFTFCTRDSGNVCGPRALDIHLTQLYDTQAPASVLVTIGSLSLSGSRNRSHSVTSDKLMVCNVELLVLVLFGHDRHASLVNSCVPLRNQGHQGSKQIFVTDGQTDKEKDLCLSVTKATEQSNERQM